jgi:hypothetical protein
LFRADGAGRALVARLEAAHFDAAAALNRVDEYRVDE